MKLNGPLTGGGNVLSFLIEPTSGSVVYMADQAVDGQNELYVAEFTSDHPYPDLPLRNGVTGVNWLQYR